MSAQDMTPGPWKAHFEEAYFVTGPDLGRVAMMMNLKGAYGLGGRRSGDESAANCRLIAAAPDLLNALTDCVHRFVAAFPEAENYGPIQLARAAIAKATGTAAPTCPEGAIARCERAKDVLKLTGGQ